MDPDIYFIYSAALPCIYSVFKLLRVYEPGFNTDKYINQYSKNWSN